MGATNRGLLAAPPSTRPAPSGSHAGPWLPTVNPTSVFERQHQRLVPLAVSGPLGGRPQAVDVGVAVPEDTAAAACLWHWRGRTPSLLVWGTPAQKFRKNWRTAHRWLPTQRRRRQRIALRSSALHEAQPADLDRKSARHSPNKKAVAPAAGPTDWISPLAERAHNEPAHAHAGRQQQPCRAAQHRISHTAC
jgi:hypothetical protein